jgi:hypothetical protein
MRRLPVFLFLLCLLPGSARAQDGAEEVRFAFAPADGEVWIERIQMENREDPGPRAPTSTWTTDETYRLHYEKQPDGGWRVRRILVEAANTAQGEPVENQIQTLTLDHPIDYLLDAQGRVVSIEGYRVLMRKLERRLDPEIWQYFRSSVSIESAVEGDQRAWDRVLAGLVGETVRVGEVWSVRDVHVAGTSPVQIFGTLRFEGWTVLEGRRAFTLRLEFVDDPADLAPPPGGFARRIDFLGEETTVPQEDRGLRGEVVRVLDPATGHVVYERSRFSFNATAGRSGAPDVEVETIETRRGRPAGPEAD